MRRATGWRRRPNFISSCIDLIRVGAAEGMATVGSEALRIAAGAADGAVPQSGICAGAAVAKSGSACRSDPEAQEGARGMPTVSVELRNVAGTEAALGWAGAHTVVIDRPEGRAGGRGLGFNGAQLLALTIGGCFCNDLRYVAHASGVELGSITVSVVVELEGDPIVATAASMMVDCKMVDGSNAETIVEKAKTVCMAINSLKRGIAVQVRTTA
jgi:organic hydroperoxide reductase OsmC/OhrA